jgi:hypothetical protein
MLYRDTTPAPRWGPTPVYGPCEERSCEGTARTTCDTCGGEFCLTHADHNEHVRPEPAS